MSKMEAKPVPKPRSTLIAEGKGTRPVPVPAPRNLHSTTVRSTPRSTSSSESSTSEKSDEGTKSCTTPEGRSSGPEFFRTLGNSSRNFKDEISEKMTSKSKAVISSTRNASLRLEKSVKNLLTRRLASLNNEDGLGGDVPDDIVDATNRKLKDTIGARQDRCVSMPTDDIFNGISFYSPLGTTLKSVRNVEDLSTVRYSPPPPIYPPPPLPEESIYDELQSVTSGHSSRYDTLSSTVSAVRDLDLSDSFDLLSFARSHGSDSDLSMNNGESNLTEKITIDGPKRLSRSDSWTFYDATPSAKPGVDLEAMSSLDEGVNEPPIQEPVLNNPRASTVSIPNSMYENWLPRKLDSDQIVVESGRETSKSLLFEFDPLARADESVYSNYENNDLMLLEALLATSESPSSAGSLADLQEQEEDAEDEAYHEVIQPKDDGVDNAEATGPPPEPPRRYDSLPKNDYDEVEMIEVPNKNPALLPKLSQLRKKQPAVPPRKPSIKIHVQREAIGVTEVATCPEEVPPPSPQVAEENRTSMMRKLQRKLRHDSVASIRPNVMSFVRGSKLLSRNRDVPKEPAIGGRLERPPYTGHKSTPQRGIVYRPGVGIERAKDLVPRAAVLQDNKLSFYTDKSMTTLKESVLLETIHSVHLLQDVKTVDGEAVHCVAISGDGRPGVHVFYVKGVTERRIWAQRILEALTPVFPVRYSSELARVGWAYVKEGVTGTWFPAWLLLQRRSLFYTRSMDPVIFEHLDLRKARCIVLREHEGPIPGGGSVPVVVVDAGGKSALHIAAPGSREGPAWKHALYQAATSCGPDIEQQQLTQDNVPVILEKCINFIYTHGIMSEGIYRRSGSSTAVARLLEAFRKDAWVTQITKVDYSEHDVATVLRRFLRDLPEPLLPAASHDSLCRIVDMKNTDERVANYRSKLERLSTVAGATLRRILAHLHCLSQQSARNRMTVTNLSAVWGPTLMHAGETKSDDWNRSETRVVGDLIELYPKLYQLSAADLAREAKILEVLERHHVSNNRPRAAPSGDLKIWIYVIARDGECVNVTLGPHKTAFDVCRELADKTGHQPHELCLEESALGGDLERPLHHNESVLETVARWGYWDVEDRKDNVLVLKRDRVYKDIVPLVNPPMTISGELKFADNKTKNFKNYLFEFSQAKLCCYKDKMCATKLHEWRIEDIVWYLGHESKRNPQMGWSITFIMKNGKPNRCKETPFFGYTLAGALKGEEYRWLAAMLFGEYQLNLRPSAVNLMDP
ncbi:uncharacterized protein LOC107216961 [Neodiprion lecontei]|uniref:Uncharacterized protein LOC107216961 n=1 Tax=Neodiprion lecontei TaxID=441921 RepID=A0A6J0B3Z3_NEOLC|nr:uncharacterized protein LOC107216961 [Neodiprion lecontei]